MLVARQILCGAGKVGAESGRSCAFQLSQRADFFVEPYNTETLFRRPIFNTRDEPHAEPADWIRLHVISGDANMNVSSTARKVGLVKLAVALAIEGQAPVWRFRRPVEAFQHISRDESFKFEVELEGGSWTTAWNILESYFAAAEAVFDLRSNLPSATEAAGLIAESRKLMADLTECPERFAQSVDWAAKKNMLEQFMEEEGLDWNAPQLRAFDLEYHNIDPDEGLFFALEQMGVVASQPGPSSQEIHLQRNVEDTRARARGLAVSQFKSELLTASWRSAVFKVGEENREVFLDPDVEYPVQLETAKDVGTFIQWIQDFKSSKQTND
jgi:proteasome accessory factor A